MAITDAIIDSIELDEGGTESITGTVVSIEGDGYVRIRPTGAEDALTARLTARCMEQDYLHIGDEVVALSCDAGRAYVVLDRLTTHSVVLDSREGGNSDSYLTIEADKSVTLNCGNSSITLRRDGKIVLRGTEIISRASKANRIRGATVSIN